MTAISEYFRTAVVIDDRVEGDYGPLEELGADETADLSGEPQPDLDPPPADDATPVHAAELVSAFVDEGIVCGVLQPDENESDLVALARRGAQIADLLILDWLLFGDDTRTIEMISAVTEANKDRLTVVVIFTGAHDLRGVVERLTNETNFNEPSDFVLQCEDTVVLVFGKPGIRLVGGEGWRTTEYRDLPARIRADLETVFGGLMPRFVFRGVNAVRDSTPRILASFGSDLDAGALVHRALLPQADDAGPQFIRLLASDLEQALHDAGVGDVWGIDSADESLARATSDGSPSELAGRLRRSTRVPQNVKDLDDESLAREAITRGLAGVGLGDSVATKAVDDLTAAFGAGVASSEALAVMMSSSDFGQTPPRLELGVVLRDDSGNYWLCIQPPCDSVRLKSQRAFPMLRLHPDKQNPAAMIRSPENTPIPIRFDTAPHRLAMPKFEPTSEHDAVAADGQPSHWRFTSVDGTEYRAVTRLRPELAAQAVQRLTSAASRPGFDASEWLRRKARS